MSVLKILKSSAGLCRNDTLHKLLRTTLPYHGLWDYRMSSFKSSSENEDLFNSIEISETPSPKLSKGEHAVFFLKTIFNQQKNQRTFVDNLSILNNPQFKEALIELRKSSRSLSVNDIIDSLKILTYLGVPANSNISYILLELLRRQVNDLNLRNIIFLDFLLNKLDSTPLVDAIKTALPSLFELQLKTKIDRDNPAELADILYFAVNKNVGGTCIDEIINALVKHGTDLETKQAQSIIWSLCMLRNIYDPVCEILLNNCFAVLNSDKGESLSFENIESTLTRLTNKYSSKNAVYYNEEFWNNCASYAIRKDVGFEGAVHILKKFNKISFVNIPLLDYCTKKARGEPFVLEQAHPAIVFNFVTGLSNASYISKDWDNLKEIVKANLLSKLDRTDLPWLKVATDLMSLQLINEDLLRRIFDEENLTKLFATDKNVMNFQLLLSLYQGATILGNYKNISPSSMKFINQAKEFGWKKNIFPLRDSLKYIYGSDVWTGVTTKFGHLIDHLVVFNEEGKHIHADLKGADLDLLEKLRGDKRSVIGILAFPQSCYALNLPKLKGIFQLKIRTLETLGIRIVAVNLSEWASLPDKEKLAYLQREINFKLAKRVAL